MSIRLGFAGAVKRVLKALGREKIGSVIKRSPSLIYKWSDPSLSYYPTIQQALSLDLEYVRGTRGAPPFLSAYTELLSESLHQPGKADGSGSRVVLSEVLRLLGEVVTLLTSVHDQSASAEAGKSPSEHGKCSICVSLRNCQEIASGLMWNIKVGEGDTICPIRRHPPVATACALSADSSVKSPG
jgi:hypothetical protein